MKFAALFFTLLVASVAADPVRVVDTSKAPQSNLIVNILKSLIDSVKEALSRIDPVKIDSFERKLNLIGFLNLGVSVNEFHITGFSDFRVDNLDYTNDVLTFNFILPKISGGAGNIKAYLNKMSIEGGGTLAVADISLNGAIGMDLGSGINVNSIDIDFKLGQIDSKLSVTALGKDYSKLINDLLNKQIPDWLENNLKSVSDLIISIIMDILAGLKV